MAKKVNSKLNPETTAILAAAGRGFRFGAKNAPCKLFALINGAPIVAGPLETLLKSDSISSVIIVHHPDSKKKFLRLLKLLKPVKPVRLVAGAKTRAESVKRGFDSIKSQPDFVLIHDGARPLLTEKMIFATIRSAKKWGAAICARPAVETVKISGADNIIAATPQRDSLFIAETPQVFSYKLLKRAYDAYKDDISTLTDEASIVEAFGAKVKLVKTSTPNPKITFPHDLLQLAQFKNPGALVGIGYDIHGLAAGRGLKLGGVKIAAPFKLIGHSDADVVLHALADALLSAVAEPDIGVQFPPEKPETKGLDSKKILKRALALVKNSGYSVHNSSIVIVLEKPKISGYVREINAKLKTLLEMKPTDFLGISVKTSEGLGVLGNSYAIAALAAVTLKKNHLPRRR